MNGIVNGFYLETGYGFDPHNSTVTEIKSINKYGMCVMGAMVFRGEWKDCVKYAETHTSPLNSNEN